MPPAKQVRDALDDLLASETFARSERARDLLRYLVEQQQAGRSDRLKGFAIAVDVFGKDASFDPSTDAVVRVQAGRLRELLDQYYAAEGADAPLRIAIPRGSYVPEYELAAPAKSDVPATEPAARMDAPSALATGPADASPPLSRRRFAVAAAIVGVLLVLFAVAGYRLGIAPPAMVAEAGGEDVTGSVARSSLPTIFLDVTGEGDEVQMVTSSLRRGLAAFDTINFIAVGHDAASNEPPVWTDFIFSVSQRPPEQTVLVELHNAASGKVLLSRALPPAAGKANPLDDLIAELLTTTIPPSGSIYAYLAQAERQTPLIRCLSFNARFYRDQNEEAHRRAYECLELLAASGAGSVLVYSELASLHLKALVNRYDYPPRSSEEQAMTLARKAVELGPQSPYAHRAQGYVLQRIGKVDEAIRWMRKAYELNEFDLGMAASYAYVLIFGGEYETGTPVMERAVRSASAHPTWWDYGLFLGHFMLSDAREAANAVAALAASDRSHYVAARLIAADMLGKHDEAGRLLERLNIQHTTFSTDPRSFFARGKYPSDMTDRLVSALRRAGLAGAS